MSILEIYQQIQSDYPEKSLCVVAVKALSETVKDDFAVTMLEFLDNLNASAEELRSSCENPIAVQAGCDHYIRYASRLVISDLTKFKTFLINYAQDFFEKSISRRESIAEYALKFITDDCVRDV